jgi:hypothetical protein
MRQLAGLVKYILALFSVCGTAAYAHDASKHKGKPIEGEVVSVAEDRFQLKTATGTVPVTFSSKTKFEYGKATVDKTHVTKGGRITVFGTKLPSGEVVAREVLIGGAEAQGAKTKGVKPAHQH